MVLFCMSSLVWLGCGRRRQSEAVSWQEDIRGSIELVLKVEEMGVSGFIFRFRGLGV